ncbi:MAG: DUF86 domain-containing protein [Candidatus Yanofskybacteria bacterium]|nr:DUF86 domain-containing protein [Candidatus Yanofskybacteria bacterium]
MDKDKIYLQHILEAIQKIESYTAGHTEGTFSNDDLVSDAVVREIEIIGEAARNMSDELKQTNREIVWRDVTDMRNFLTHEYFKVDRHVVWNTITKDLPVMREEVKRLLKELHSN